MTNFAGSQLTSRVFCTLHEISAKKNSQLGTRQWTRIAKKVLKLRNLRRAEAAIDTKYRSIFNLEDTAHSCGHVIEQLEPSLATESCEKEVSDYQSGGLMYAN